jgi:transcriptional regulator with XRE-family HTH domain
MPKKPKIETPLRKLREFTGKTQIAFATALGCSSSTIKKIEGGDNSKLSASLLMSLGNVFAVSPESLLPPSVQPRELFEDKPYTKEFFENWWKKGKQDMESFNLRQKQRMVEDLETILAAAMRVPGRSFGAVLTSYYDWLIDLMDDCRLWPHYETELQEWLKKARSSNDKFQCFLADLVVQSLRDNNLNSLPDIFNPNLLPTTLLGALFKRKKGNLKKGLPNKLSKLEKLKAQKYEMHYILCKEL